MLSFDGAYADIKAAADKMSRAQAVEDAVEADTLVRQAYQDLYQAVYRANAVLEAFTSDGREQAVGFKLQARRETEEFLRVVYAGYFLKGEYPHDVEAFLGWLTRAKAFLDEARNEALTKGGVYGWSD
ncbi:MAG: hypothetical protein AB2L09_07455 [Coriobacteriia bacterium]